VISIVAMVMRPDPATDSDPLVNLKTAAVFLMMATKREGS
jgi:hypothetical protein